MKTLYFVIILLYCSVAIGQSEEKELKSIIEKQEADWNKNDMKAFSSAFDENAVLINFLGMYWKGRENIIEQFSRINDCCIKPTLVHYEWVYFKLISENAAFAHIKETLTAKEDYAVPGGVVKKGTVNVKYITAVFEKKNAAWKIASMQVTQVNAPSKQ